jgi:beta-lactamase regulating signal transducer with metallopeptidase domain
MFAARGISVSLSIFLVIYTALSLVTLAVWRRAWVWGQRHSAKSCADLLFVLRVAPPVFAIGFTLILAVPSFLLLEPRAVNEAVGGPSLWLGACGVAMLLAGIWNGAAALIRASRAVARWSADSSTVTFNQLGFTRSVSVLRSSAAAPPLITSGILRPSVWLSQPAESVLTQRELHSALKHETVHVRRRDNLRKLILRLVAFPGMKKLETAWCDATEMTADDAAVSNISEALDLAAAVIKLSRLASVHPLAELTTALVHGPAGSVNARVERLIAWKEQQHSSPHSFAYGLFASAAALAGFVLTYSTLLVRIHAATEWLVR